MYESSNWANILKPGLARIFFKEHIWLMLKLKGRWVFERAFKAWIKAFPHE